MTSTLADRLQNLRNERFVGRDAECDRFKDMLSGQLPPIWHLYASGGMGKSTLLKRFLREAEKLGRISVLIDASQIPATPRGWQESLRGSLQLAQGEALPSGLVLLIDTYEAIEVLDQWLRDEELPSFPSDACIVFAGRTIPSPLWQLDPGWDGLAMVSSLAPWSAQEALAYWQARLPDASPNEIEIAQGQGHPLLLALLTEVRRREGGGSHGAEDRVGLLRGVLQQLTGLSLVDSVEQRALEVLLIARVVDEDMLAQCVDTSQSASIFRSLASLPFVEQSDYGIRIHDLVRENFADYWLSRDAKATNQLREKIFRYLIGRLMVQDKQLAPVYVKDWLYVMGHPDVIPQLDRRHLLTHYLDEGIRRAGDAQMIRQITASRFGHCVQAAVLHWLNHSPQSFFLTRRSDGQVVGFFIALELNQIAQEQLAGDEIALHMLCWVCQQRQPQGSVWLLRLIVDASGDQLPSPTATVSSIPVAIRSLLQQDKEWNLMIHHNRDAMLPAYKSFTRFNWHSEQPSLSFEQDGQNFSVFVRDFLTEPVPESNLPAVRIHMQGLMDEDAFQKALNDAWRQIYRDDLMSCNPLLEGTLTLRTPNLIREALHASVQALTVRPQDMKFHHALRRTWLDTGCKQEAVASELGLPFNTYRYHLAKGAERAARWLWMKEIQARRLGGT